MSSPVITVENLGKRYRIRHQAKSARYTALRDVLADKTKSVARRLWSVVRDRNFSISAFRGSRISGEDFWALKGVSFEVHQSEVVGIIGRNGAGKSTLLKILSRITEPTEGRVRLRGRVASLLEVGTGFHPELTGRENIFLNGAILGMSRAEIKHKFDEIVAFAEVEKFLDTPVKHYSSGMYVRLAFAVAAHLDPEILIVDEVLAVGDAEFQKKCLGKMGSVAQGGRTILFVSHNMAAIQTLCKRAFLIKAGTIVSAGDVAEQVRSYLEATGPQVPVLARFPKQLSSEIMLLDLSFHKGTIKSGDSLTFRLSLASSLANSVKDCALLVYSGDGIRVAILDLRSETIDAAIRPGVRWTVRGAIEALNLVEGNYSVGMHLRCGDCQRDHYDLTCFRVLPADCTTSIPPYDAQHRGFVEIKFSIEPCASNEIATPCAL